MLEEEEVSEIEKAVQLIKISETLQRRIEGHLSVVCKAAMKKANPTHVAELIKALPDGHHRNEMRGYLTMLETGKPPSDDSYED